MDPLGARSQFVDIQSLPVWQQQLSEEAKETPLDQGDGPLVHEAFPSPFPFRPDINRKIILFTGDVALLNCTAIVNTSNESLSDKNPVSDSIHQLAGPELREELVKLKGCRTGEAKLTKGFNLAARFIIHTVGPKYKAKYRTAAESSLFSCYRNVMQLAAYVTWCDKRTVRRFLENHGNGIDTVVFAVSDTEESVYKKLLSLYYPRSEEEERRCLPLIPADIGNSEGEPVVPERQIRIAEKPGSLEDECREENLELDLGQVGNHAFARMEGDVDKQRKLILQGQMSEAAVQKQHQRNYSRWLCRARAEDLSDIAALKALYQTGVDICGRTVMVVVGRNIPVTLIDLEKALLYFIHVMDHITVKEYVIVYFHTLTGEHNHLDSDFLKNLYDVVDIKYKKNLRAFYFVHPTFRSKVSTWFFTTFSVSGLKEKVRYLDNLPQLFTCIKPEQIDIPPFVLEYDARVSGPNHPNEASGL
ncbi:ganglioside-induced differentiation-associated protein 2 [Poecilia reticulata]|uniref:ganglioside-induced differentiation-associated protein 2 n=1 Tax=Poecilia reticulata TaxID=8081 RepID=UPI0007EB71D4|nr:PREDICTED: ganglioside-induced differentiation-associated protein 2 [Poecilia reticulata]